MGVHEQINERDRHEKYFKLLAYAGRPPYERLSLGVTGKSEYRNWVRAVAYGLSVLYPDRRNGEIYGMVIDYAAWCRDLDKGERQ